MNVPRDHHFLPRFLLEPWCAADGKLTAYSKPHGNVAVARRYAPSEVAKKSNLYTYDKLPDGKAQVIETAFLQKVDNGAALAFQTAYRDGPDKISREERLNLTVFILSLRVRHPDSIAMMRKEGTAELLKELDKDPAEATAAGLPEGHKLSEFVQKKNPALIPNFGLSILPNVLLNEKYVDRLGRLEWCDIKFPAVGPDLVISDRACLLDGNLLGQCFMVLPVAPRRAIFIASQRETIERARSENQAQLVKRINKWSVLSAAEYVYASGGQHMPLVKSRLHKRGQGGA